MSQAETRILCFVGACVLASNPAPAERGVAQVRALHTSRETADAAFFEGSTIVSMATNFQPGLIYKKYPTDESVVPGVVWQLSFGALLASKDPAINVTLSLDAAGQSNDIQVVNDTASFVEKGGLYNNYDPSERFEVVYNGTLSPFLGPVDFLLEPEGLAAIPVRVHLNVTDQTGFPFPLASFSGVSVPLGDITGDGNLEIVVPRDEDGQEGLYAFDHSGNLLPGWPLRDEGPDVVDQGFSTPALADLDDDGQEEVIVLGFTQRNVAGQSASAGFEFTQTLYAIEGSGAIRWQITDDFTPGGIPAIADIDDDGLLDIVVGFGANLIRLGPDGIPKSGWQVETSVDITVRVPVLADVDGASGNKLEIIACASVSVPQPGSQLFVWNHDGSFHDAAWPRAVDSCRPATVFDLDANAANGQEIVFAFDHGSDPPVDPDTGFLNTFSVFAWHHDGTDVTGWPHHFLRDPSPGFFDDRVIAPASAGDLDGDGDMEVVVGTYGQGEPVNGNLFVFHHDGTLDGNWPQWAGVAQTPSVGGGMALGDLDGDGQSEIVTASFLGVYVFRANGEPFDGFPRMTSEVFTQPTIADLDSDGNVEIAVLPVFDRLHVWHLLTPSPDPLPWPRFRQNPMRTGARHSVPVGTIPTVSTTGWIIMVILVVCAGIGIIGRKDGEPES